MIHVKYFTEVKSEVDKNTIKENLQRDSICFSCFKFVYINPISFRQEKNGVFILDSAIWKNILFRS